MGLTNAPSDLLPGTLELLILKALVHGTKSPFLLPAPSATSGLPTPEPSTARPPGVGLVDATALPDFKLSHIYTQANTN